MKRLTLMLFVFLSLILFACSKAENPLTSEVISGDAIQRDVIVGVYYRGEIISTFHGMIWGGDKNSLTILTVNVLSYLLPDGVSAKDIQIFACFVGMQNVEEIPMEISKISQDFLLLKTPTPEFIKKDFQPPRMYSTVLGQAVYDEYGNFAGMTEAELMKGLDYRSVNVLSTRMIYNFTE